VTSGRARAGRRYVAIVWAPLAVLAAHTAITELFGHQLALDPVFHFAGGMAGAHALQRLSRRFEGNRAVIAMLVVTLSWELMEFVSDLMRGTHVQRGPLDTWSDVALGVAGAAVRAWFGRARRSDASG
jgi:hypothetical protein